MCQSLLHCCWICGICCFLEEKNHNKNAQHPFYSHICINKLKQPSSIFFWSSLSATSACKWSRLSTLNLQFLEFPFLQKGLIRLQVLNKKRKDTGLPFPEKTHFSHIRTSFSSVWLFQRLNSNIAAQKKIHPVSPQPLAVSHGLPGLIAGRYSPEPLNKLFNNMSPRIDSLSFFS